MRSASLIPPPKASAPAGGFSVGLGLRVHLFLPLLGAGGVNSAWLYTEGSHLSGCPVPLQIRLYPLKSIFFVLYVYMVYMWRYIRVYVHVCKRWHVRRGQQTASCTGLSFASCVRRGLLPYCSVLCSQASRSSSLQGVSRLHLSSCQRDTQDADTCYHAKLYVGPGDSNSKLHACIASPLPAKPCPQHANRTLLKCLSNVLTGRGQAPLTKKTLLKW